MYACEPSFAAVRKFARNRSVRHPARLSHTQWVSANIPMEHSKQA